MGWLAHRGEVGLTDLGHRPSIVTFRSPAGLAGTIWLPGDGTALVGYHRRAACRVRGDE